MLQAALTALAVEQHQEHGMFVFVPLIIVLVPDEEDAFMNSSKRFTGAKGVALQILGLQHPLVLIQWSSI